MTHFYTCTGGCILRPGQYVFAARLDALPRDEGKHGLLVMVTDGEYRFATRDQSIASVCSLTGDEGKPMVCVLPASDHELGLYDDGLVLLGRETYADKSATTAAMVRSVEGDLLVVGMNGQIQRTAGAWASFSQGIAPGLDPMLDTSDDKALVDAVIHLMLNSTHVTAIDGAQGAWYCTDSEGRVHVRTDTDWQALPTNLGAWLTDITVAGSDAFCVVGHKGVLGLGNAQDVRPLPHDVDDSFTCSVAFQGSVFIGGYQGVYRLTGDALLRVTELGDEAFHCVALSACDTAGDRALVRRVRWCPMAAPCAAWQRPAGAAQIGTGCLGQLDSAPVWTVAASRLSPRLGSMSRPVSSFTARLLASIT